MLTSLNDLLKIAENRNKKTLAIAAAEDESVLNAVIKARETGLITPVFIGNSEKIIVKAAKSGFQINKNEIIHSENDNQSCLKAVRMVAAGEADILMKGLVATGTLLKHVVAKDLGLLTGKLLSHLAIFETPYYHKLIGLTDAAMNISPDLEEKLAIVQNAVESFEAIGIKNPKVAILAAVEKVNTKMQATLDAAMLKVMNERGQLTNCIIDGPLALDNAISAEAAQHKGISSPVAGDVDILIAPDIQAGNILYKSLVFLGNAKCAAIITGSKSPIVLTSRADNEETKFFSIALAVLTSKK